MKPQAVLMFAMAILWLAVVAGCKGSQKSEPSPAQSQSATTPAATPDSQIRIQVVKTQPTSAPPPMASMVPVKTFALAPPAFFGNDQIAKHTAVEFHMTAKASQVLRVKVNEIARVQVQFSSDGSAALKPGLDADGNWLYVLPQSGAYRVLFAPVYSPSIEFWFLPDNDPLADPGIKPSQFSIEFGSFARPEQMAMIPYFFTRDEGYSNSWPTHLAVVNDHFEFRIMPVAAYKQMFGHDQRIEVLLSAIMSGGKNENVASLPYARAERWCGYITSVRREVLEGQGWHGLRWIGGFGGDEAYPSCGLGYVFAGISDDEKFLIVLRADISHLDQKRFDPHTESAASPGRTTEAVNSDLATRLRMQLEQSLATAEPSSFEPGLDQLDAVVRSLKFKK